MLPHNVMDRPDVLRKPGVPDFMRHKEVLNFCMSFHGVYGAPIFLTKYMYNANTGTWIERSLGQLNPTETSTLFVEPIRSLPHKPPMDKSTVLTVRGVQWHGPKFGFWLQNNSEMFDLHVHRFIPDEGFSRENGGILREAFVIKPKSGEMFMFDPTDQGHRPYHYEFFFRTFEMPINWEELPNPYDMPRQ